LTIAAKVSLRGSDSTLNWRSACIIWVAADTLDITVEGDDVVKHIVGHNRPQEAAEEEQIQ